jgi:hypothetical protein
VVCPLLFLDLSGWNLDKLTLTPPKGFDGEIKLQVKATATELKNGSTAATTRELAVQVLEGNACATPVGLNPYVSYLNNSAVIGTSKLTLLASPLRPENRSYGIYLPGKSSHGHEEPKDSDEAMANWMKGLEHSLSSAFLEEMEKVLGGGKRPKAA